MHTVPHTQDAADIVKSLEGTRIMKEAGTDATFAFDNQDHSAKARMWMKAFEVMMAVSF